MLVKELTRSTGDIQLFDMDMGEDLHTLQPYRAQVGIGGVVYVECRNHDGTWSPDFHMLGGTDQRVCFREWEGLSSFDANAILLLEVVASRGGLERLLELRRGHLKTNFRDRHASRALADIPEEFRARNDSPNVRAGYARDMRRLVRQDVKAVRAILDAIARIDEGSQRTC